MQEVLDVALPVEPFVAAGACAARERLAEEDDEALW
jgi:hypothetical protein